MKENKKSFEEAMQELEKIVGELERGETSLNDSLVKFKEGIELSKQCNDILDKTEKEINILINEKDGNIKEEKFEVEE